MKEIPKEDAMDIPKIKLEAGEALARASYPPRRLMAIHAGAALGLSLILTAVSYFLSNHTGGSGGIGGLGAQAALSTVQTVLQLAGTVVMPFWSAGLVFCALSYARGHRAEPISLLEGFRRFRPILSSVLMMGLRYLGVGFLSVYLSSSLLMVTPAALPVMNASQQLLEDPSADPYALLGDALPIVMLWYLGIFLIVFAVLALPLFYRWRLVNYLIMDDPKTGGLQAMVMSRGMMTRRRMELFRLDLSFWWFYVLEFLAVGLAYGDVLLAAVGVTLPLPDGAAFWCFALLSLACQFGLYVWAKPKLAVTYAFAYEALRQPPEPKTQKPVSHPWND